MLGTRNCWSACTGSGVVIIAFGAYDSIASDASDGSLVPGVADCILLNFFARCDGAANTLRESREPSSVGRKIVKEEGRPQGNWPRRRRRTTGGGGRGGISASGKCRTVLRARAHTMRARRGGLWEVRVLGCRVRRNLHGYQWSDVCLWRWAERFAFAVVGAVAGPIRSVCGRGPRGEVAGATAIGASTDGVVYPLPQK